MLDQAANAAACSPQKVAIELIQYSTKERKRGLHTLMQSINPKEAQWRHHLKPLQRFFTTLDSSNTAAILQTSNLNAASSTVCYTHKVSCDWLRERHNGNYNEKHKEHIQQLLPNALQHCHSRKYAKKVLVLCNGQKAEGTNQPCKTMLSYHPSMLWM